MSTLDEMDYMPETNITGIRASSSFMNVNRLKAQFLNKQTPLSIINTKT